METVLEHIRRRGLASRGRVDIEKILSLSKRRLLDIAEELASLTPGKGQRQTQGISSHTASASLGGGREGCAYLGCRGERLDSLARFAAFYSDRVFIRNYFCDYWH